MWDFMFVFIGAFIVVPILAVANNKRLQQWQHQAILLNLAMLNLHVQIVKQK